MRAAAAAVATAVGGGEADADAAADADPSASLSLLILLRSHTDSRPAVPPGEVTVFELLPSTGLDRPLLLTLPLPLPPLLVDAAAAAAVLVSSDAVPCCCGCGLSLLRRQKGDLGAGGELSELAAVVAEAGRAVGSGGDLCAADAAAAAAAAARAAATASCVGRSGACTTVRRASSRIAGSTTRRKPAHDSRSNSRIGSCGRSHSARHTNTQQQPRRQRSASVSLRSAATLERAITPVVLSFLASLFVWCCVSCLTDGLEESLQLRIVAQMEEIAQQHTRVGIVRAALRLWLQMMVRVVRLLLLGVELVLQHWQRSDCTRAHLDEGCNNAGGGRIVRKSSALLVGAGERRRASERREPAPHTRGGAEQKSVSTRRKTKQEKQAQRLKEERKKVTNWCK